MIVPCFSLLSSLSSQSPSAIFYLVVFLIALQLSVSFTLCHGSLQCRNFLPPCITSLAGPHGACVLFNLRLRASVLARQERLSWSSCHLCASREVSRFLRWCWCSTSPDSGAMALSFSSIRRVWAKLSDVWVLRLHLRPNSNATTAHLCSHIGISLKAPLCSVASTSQLSLPASVGRSDLTLFEQAWVLSIGGV